MGFDGEWVGREREELSWVLGLYNWMDVVAVTELLKSNKIQRQISEMKTFYLGRKLQFGGHAHRPTGLQYVP